MPEKYQEEIEEILQRVGEAPPGDPPNRSKRALEDRPQVQQPSQPAPAPRHGSSPRWPTITPGKILLSGLILFVAAALLKQGTLLWIGLGLLVVAYLLFFITPRSVSYGKRWRGQPLDGGYSTPWERFKRWLKN
jgi:hypothetical protein